MRKVLVRHLCRRGRDLLLLLAVTLPFEARLFRLGPLQITTVELVLYATLGVWLANLALEGFFFQPSRWWTAIRGTDGLTQGATLLAAATFVSAFAAPTPNTAPLKFALRTVSGILLLFCTRSLLRREDARPMCGAIVLGSLLSAFSAVLDSTLAVQRLALDIVPRGELRRPRPAPRQRGVWISDHRSNVLGGERATSRRASVSNMRMAPVPRRATKRAGRREAGAWSVSRLGAHSSSAPSSRARRAPAWLERRSRAPRSSHSIGAAGSAFAEHRRWRSR